MLVLTQLPVAINMSLCREDDSAETETMVRMEQSIMTSVPTDEASVLEI